MNRVKYRKLLNWFYFKLINIFGNKSCTTNFDFTFFSNSTLHFIAPGESIKLYKNDDFHDIPIGINFVFKSHPEFKYYLIEITNNYTLNFIDEINNKGMFNKIFFVKGYNHPKNIITFIKFLILTKNNRNIFVFLKDYWIQDFKDDSLIKNYFPCNAGSTLAYLPSLTRYFMSNEFILSGFDFSNKYSFDLQNLIINNINRNGVIKSFYKQNEIYKTNYKFHKKSVPF